ncbi:hypothetical protein C7N43_39370 [Sphingobacteriales bacterium UPWRP_1]|nr:hypothetical protein C7N43_39370 [Sphingobacteriales bacterium UPWRP_1]
MTEKHLYMKDLHFEHQLWSSELAFCKDELKILDERLREVALKNTTMEAKALVEHFQNQFIRQNEVIDEYRHKINEHENFLISEAEKHPVAIEHRFFPDHAEMREEMHIFRKLYADLKHEFVNFLARYM